VLDLIEANADNWPADFEERLRIGKAYAADAIRMKLLKDRRTAAILGAAMLIDAADEMGRLIDAAG